MDFDHYVAAGRDTGWFGSSLVKSVRRGVKRLGKSVSKVARGAVRGVTSVAKTVSPVANLLSQVPGVGTVAGATIGAVAAVGRGESLTNIAMHAARGAAPGPLGKLAFDVAMGAVRGRGLGPTALRALRSQVATTPAAQAAFDGAVAIASGASKGQILRAVSHMPPSLRSGFVRTVAAHHLTRVAVARGVSPARVMSVVRQGTAVRRVVTKPRKLSRDAQRFMLGVFGRRRETRGLSADGLTYTVEPNDSAWRIAQRLTGDGDAHWKELLQANSPPKEVGNPSKGWRRLNKGEVPRNDDNFRFLAVGSTLVVPQAWRDAAKAELERRAKAAGVPAAAAPPPSVVVSLPSPGTPPPKATASVDDIVAKSPGLPQLPSGAPPAANAAASDILDDPQAIAQAKLILAIWGRTDGVAAAGLPDYGQRADDTSPIFGPRDAFQLRAYVVWRNTQPPPVQLDVSSDLTQAKLDSLVRWAEARAQVVGSALPRVPNGSPAASNGNATAAPVQVANPLGEIPVVVPAAVTETVPETQITGDGAAEDDSTWLWLCLGGVGVLAAASLTKKRRAA